MNIASIAGRRGAGRTWRSLLRFEGRRDQPDTVLGFRIWARSNGINVNADLPGPAVDERCGEKLEGSVPAEDDTRPT